MLAVLKKHWGHEAFRGRQAEIINATMMGQDVLAIMATGSGTRGARRKGGMGRRLPPGGSRAVLGLTDALQASRSATRSLPW